MSRRGIKPDQGNRIRSARSRAGRIKGPGQERTVIYTDGACSGNPGPGGWAWVIPNGKYRSGAKGHTTNQRMELMAALDAARSVEGTLEIVSDSTYVVNCFRDGWWKGWLSRGWTNTKKQPVANRDLWEPLVEIFRTGRLTFRWVKGHAGNQWNDLADRLAVEASLSQQGVEGSGSPPRRAPIPSQDQPGPKGGALLDSSGNELPPDRTVVYAEGTSPPGSEQGGWAWMAPGRRYRSGAAKRATNPRMELTASLDAVRDLDGALLVVTESKYVVNCFQNRWWKGWLSRGWVNSRSKPVANRDLWEPLIEMYRTRRIAFRPPGPSDEEWTSQVKWLAGESSRTQYGTEGQLDRT